MVFDIGDFGIADNESYDLIQVNRKPLQHIIVQKR